MKRATRTICVVATMAAVSAAVVVPALANAAPSVSGMSTHRGPYWGGTTVTITGDNFTGVDEVTFGAKPAWSVDVVSPTKITVVAPYHSYDHVYVRVHAAAGTSSPGSAAAFDYTRPRMSDPIQGGLTGDQEQKISRQVRAAHRNAHIAPRSRRWTAAMGRSAVRRARSWIGTPYSWAGGNGSGPTTGVCAHNGGDLDCHIVGFDCSGLTLYSWWPYEHLVHYAATQHHEAGRFHPTIGELMPGDLVFFSGYIADGIGHTAVYAGNGEVVEAPQSGMQVTTAQLSDVIADSGVYRGATRPMTTGKQGAGPHVSTVTRTVPAKGGRITITGHGLSGVTSLDVGGQRIYRFVRQTGDHLVATVPAHAAGTVRVTVSNAWATVDRSLTYVGAPVVTALGQTTGTTAGGNTVTVVGRGLDRVTKAAVGGTTVGVHVLSPTRATITMPAHAAGAVPVTLTSAYGTSAPLTYTYVTPTPTPTPSPTSTTPAAGKSHPSTGTPPTSATPTAPSSTAPSSTASTSAAPTGTSPAPTPTGARASVTTPSGTSASSSASSTSGSSPPG